MPNTSTSNIKNNVSANGFNKRGQVARVLKEFDHKLTESVQDTLNIENARLSRAEKEERQTELRKQALPNEEEFEYKLSKAYRKDYGQPIPAQYLKQVARSIKNLLERVRFYSYSPAFIPVADYAPPTANKPAGKKFTELDNKSWASISEPGDERYPGWYQSTTAQDDIAEWLAETTIAPTVNAEHVSQNEDPDEDTHQTKRRHSSESMEPPNKRQGRSPLEADESGFSDNIVKTPASQFLMSPFSFEHNHFENRDLQNWYLDQSEPDNDISAPTPQAVTFSPFNDQDDVVNRYYIEPEDSSPFNQVSRGPTPGLDFKEELISAVNALPRSTGDIVHYFQLAHQGRPEQKARALFRLSRDLEQGKEIDINQYLYSENDANYPDSGPPTRSGTPLQVFNIAFDDTDDETREERGRRSSSEGEDKQIQPREESRQRMIKEFLQIKSAGLGDTQLHDLRFPFYNRKRLPLTGQPTPRVKPQGEVPGRQIHHWIEADA